MGLCKDAECHVDCSFECYTHETNILSTSAIAGNIGFILLVKCFEFPDNTEEQRRAVESPSLSPTKVKTLETEIFSSQELVTRSRCPYIGRRYEPQDSILIYNLDILYNIYSEQRSSNHPTTPLQLHIPLISSPRDLREHAHIIPIPLLQPPLKSRPIIAPT